MCGISLPLTPVAGDLNGIRIGTQEVTRWGMAPTDMPAIARLIARVALHGEEPERVKGEVIGFRRAFQKLCFVRGGG
jgi:glycine hydroxymethyltransferase